MTGSDVLKFTWIADPQISPRGSTVAFVRVTVNEKEKLSRPGEPRHRVERLQHIVGWMDQWLPFPPSLRFGAARRSAQRQSRQATSRLDRNPADRARCVRC